MVGIIFRPLGGEGVGVRLFPIAQSRRGKYILGNKRRCVAVIGICYTGDLIAVRYKLYTLKAELIGEADSAGVAVGNVNNIAFAVKHY